MTVAKAAKLVGFDNQEVRLGEGNGNWVGIGRAKKSLK